MTSFAFRETLMSHLLIWGNAYAQVIRNARGEVVALYPLMPNKMTVNCKNYLSDGGDRLVIGGTLEVLDTAIVTGLQSGYATEQTAGSVYQATNQAESAATTISDLVSDFNALLQKLKDARIMMADQPGSM